MPLKIITLETRTLFGYPTTETKMKRRFETGRLLKNNLIMKIFPFKRLVIIIKFQQKKCFN